MIGTSWDESETVSDIESGKLINPAPSFVIISGRQLNFLGALKTDIVNSRKAFKAIRSLPEDDLPSKERKTRAKIKIHQDRKELWKSLTTPLKFESFSGVIKTIDTTTVFLGPNSGATRLDLSMELYGSGAVLTLRQLLDEKNDSIDGDGLPKWKITDKEGRSIDWYGLGEGVPISISGRFVRYTEKNQWVHCCVTVASWPKFAVRGAVHISVLSE